MSQESLTAILHQDVKAAPSKRTAKELASMVGRDYQTLMSELSRQPNHKLGADLVLPIMRLTGSMAGLKYLAAGMNAVCVKLPSGESVRPVHRQCLAAVDQFGQLMRSMAQALEDDTITPRERNEIRSKGYDALAAIVTLLKVVDLDANEELS
ncbi:phage regulatory CII family protein [uncultured Mailhella sp.]|uniref:phage regulatory CII family protein n=1 Tax=uncultured Mailhella sp. TaxID=1981031 RepID=UPI002630DEA6|nr:phage regulatory CII family protein [uncultured Mailhella sp.]